ncbi:hypothetical protein CAPTEDRAFT_200707 [Capitella teleta]|uniref:Uncharacterized protein n=1 Tax=Capitella teleta TaxID=283909 RepID=R7V0M5_CAPTE|nr:hypothetical protein CAPTEDRAFT_200707 [Capitella teleta]|eukprot:ELU09231.1 hypothetical protein CAPTEDRAFT_200707 [Capitella teleta]
MSLFQLPQPAVHKQKTKTESVHDVKTPSLEPCTNALQCTDCSIWGSIAWSETKTECDSEVEEDHEGDEFPREKEDNENRKREHLSKYPSGTCMLQKSSFISSDEDAEDEYIPPSPVKVNANYEPSENDTNEEEMIKKPLKGKAADQRKMIETNFSTNIEAPTGSHLPGKEGFYNPNGSIMGAGASKSEHQDECWSMELPQTIIKFASLNLSLFSLLPKFRSSTK